MPCLCKNWQGFFIEQGGNIMSILCKLAGVSFNGCQQNIKNISMADFPNISLVREPNNPFDTNAVKVVLRGSHLGYLPKPLAGRLAPEMDAGMYFEAECLSKNTCSYNDTVGLTIKIYPA
jgi:hypothetical protein